MFDGGSGRVAKVSKVAAAISYWLTYDVTDLPIGITRLSFDSYTRPVAKDVTLPMRLFGRSLNLKRIRDKGIKWLICVAECDSLVDESAALAPLDFVEAEVAVFPKGHASIATSWSSPASQCSLETKNTWECAHGSNANVNRRNTSRGPVRFHLDFEKTEEVRREIPELLDAA